MTAVRSRGALESRIFPFTTYPGGEYEPKFSPDGSWIAFIWNKENESAAHLYIKSVKTGELRRVTSGLRANTGATGRSIAIVFTSLSRKRQAGAHSSATRWRLETSACSP
ncbi:MAG: PD40 domain-containing protein [Acidobacteriaceae bacterium]|nr:PD40 domain-containing protein [Acidobacteriaceae bacterium]